MVLDSGGNVTPTNKVGMAMSTLMSQRAKLLVMQ